MKNYRDSKGNTRVRVNTRFILAAGLAGLTVIGSMSGCSFKGDSHVEQAESSDYAIIDQMLDENPTMLYTKEKERFEHEITGADYGLSIIVDNLVKEGYVITMNDIKNQNRDPYVLGRDNETPQMGATLKVRAYKVLTPERQQEQLLRSYLDYVINYSKAAELAKIGASGVISSILYGSEDGKLPTNVNNSSAYGRNLNAYSRYYSEEFGGIPDENLNAYLTELSTIVGDVYSDLETFGGVISYDEFETHVREYLKVSKTYGIKQ